LKRCDDEDEDGEAAFARAMADDDVVPLPPESRDRAPGRPATTFPPIDRSPRTRDARSDADGEPDEDFAVDGVDRREIRKLKRGEYVAADRRDLHGMTAAAARDSVKQFLAASRRRRYRCVCIVHGRGLRSAGGVPVLKAHVREFLRSHPAVLAFADAPPGDGGTGAVYVLLRRG
jgi:DNA-nicking Smr family endonuclease